MSHLRCDILELEKKNSRSDCSLGSFFVSMNNVPKFGTQNVRAYMKGYGIIMEAMMNMMWIFALLLMAAVIFEGIFIYFILREYRKQVLKVELLTKIIEERSLKHGKGFDSGEFGKSGKPGKGDKRRMW